MRGQIPVGIMFVIVATVIVVAFILLLVVGKLGIVPQLNLFG